MAQQDRDRLVTLRKAQNKLITQRQAGEESGIGERQVRRLLKRLRKEGDRAVIHGLRGKPSKRRIDADRRQQIIEILSAGVYQGFGPTLASEYLSHQHGVRIGREALRGL